ncbi:MAG: bifunctional phosphopantothenoylcysteine decarboxylase/phosphopantothenate--cysteine ligase CoaBC [Ignavibacteriaceae bacterium]|nr:bifunctional phosphopantothenoylcysteine decarboxylase/phosphopantothenate--cysteine ligase CoaBC [Ignavibacteriaceae bacterium]
MLKSKILFKISGSIAAYKSAYLISKLVQNGFDVQTVVTTSSLHFIGKATLEGLTGKPVLIDQYEDGKMMSHINLMKWADLIILCPASANTINKMANGIADNLVTSLFLAHSWDKPYLIAPAMNTAMYKHPATQESLKRLKDWGVDILPTDSGHLACGDIGEGKLFDPDHIYDHIVDVLNNQNGNSDSKKSILITAGATRESIDGVRFITNLSTGNTAATIADHLSSKGYKVTYLHGINTLLPNNKTNNIQYRDFQNFKETLNELLESNYYDSVIHLAAISDYTVDKIKSEELALSGSGKSKLDSELSNLTINLKPTSKIVDKIKSISKNKDVVLFAFKFSGSSSLDESKKEVGKLLKHSNADFVVLNHLQDRTKDGIQTNYYIFNKSALLKNVENSTQLAIEIEQIIKV